MSNFWLENHVCCWRVVNVVSQYQHTGLKIHWRHFGSSKQCFDFYSAVSPVSSRINAKLYIYSGMRGWTMKSHPLRTDIEVSYLENRWEIKVIGGTECQANHNYQSRPEDMVHYFSRSEQSTIELTNMHRTYLSPSQLCTCTFYLLYPKLFYVQRIPPWGYYSS